MTNFGDIGQLQHKMGFPAVQFDGPGPSKLSEEDLQEVLALRMTLLTEELNEYKEAYFNDDLVEMADALVDLVVIAMGTAHILGLPWEQLWAEVHRSNMTKRRANPDGSNSARSSRWDLTKDTPDYRKPDLRRILEAFGWEV